jgi:hypothetical protein
MSLVAPYHSCRALRASCNISIFCHPHAPYGCLHVVSVCSSGIHNDAPPFRRTKQEHASVRSHSQFWHAQVGAAFVKEFCGAFLRTMVMAVCVATDVRNNSGRRAALSDAGRILPRVQACNRTKVWSNGRSQCQHAQTDASSATESWCIAWSATESCCIF